MGSNEQMEWTIAYVGSIPTCDYDGCERVAVVDGVTDSGPWAYMCHAHYARHGQGIGLGLGQMLTDDMDMIECIETREA